MLAGSGGYQAKKYLGREDQNFEFLILNCYHLYLGKIWKRGVISGEKEFFFITMPSDGQ